MRQRPDLPTPLANSGERCYWRDPRGGMASPCGRPDSADWTTWKIRGSSSPRMFHGNDVTGVTEHDFRHFGFIFLAAGSYGRALSRSCDALPAVARRAMVIARAGNPPILRARISLISQHARLSAGASLICGGGRANAACTRPPPCLAASETGRAASSS